MVPAGGYIVGMTARVRAIDLGLRPSLEDHGLVEGEAALVAALIARGRALDERLGTRRVWMVNSTASGGGVAEMLPHTCRLLRELGLDARWLVLEPDDSQFFTVTKALHRLLHGKEPGVPIDDGAAACFRRVSLEGARALVGHLEPGDIVVVHDPQPAGLGALLPPELDVRLVWRCHIGTPYGNEHTEQGWRFLEPWLPSYRRHLFTSERYVPPTLKATSGVVTPAIDPLSHKNRELSTYKLLGILRSAGLVADHVPEWTRFAAPAARWDAGRFVVAPLPCMLWCPVILQVSRFDELKGFHRLLGAFRVLVERGPERARSLRVAHDRAADELGRSILVLAGPDPIGVADDPEAASVLADLCRQRDALPPDIAARVHILKLPMVDAKQNALIVNALQRLASVVVQPSIEEGFGLTVTEAMWKGSPVVGTNVGGIGQQIRPGVDGYLVDEPASVDAIADAILAAIVLVKQTERMARSARRHVAQHFLSLREVMQWLDVIESVAWAPALEAEPAAALPT